MPSVRPGLVNPIVKDFWAQLKLPPKKSEHKSLHLTSPAFLRLNIKDEYFIKIGIMLRSSIPVVMAELHVSAINLYI
jgi:hypothetical protein